MTTPPAPPASTPRRASPPIPRHGPGFGSAPALRRDSGSYRPGPGWKGDVAEQTRLAVALDLRRDVSVVHSGATPWAGKGAQGVGSDTGGRTSGGGGGRASRGVGVGPGRRGRARVRVQWPGSADSETGGEGTRPGTGRAGLSEGVGTTGFDSCS